VGNVSAARPLTMRLKAERLLALPENAA